MSELLDQDDLRGAVVLATSLDRFSRTEAGWETIRALSKKRQQVLICLLWPLRMIQDVLSAAMATLSAFRLPAGILLRTSTFSTIKASNALPFMLPVVVAGPDDLHAVDVTTQRIAAAQGFVKGFMASSYQGSSRLVVPAKMIAARRVTQTLAQQLVKHIQDSHLTSTTAPKITGHIVQPRAGSARHKDVVVDAKLVARLTPAFVLPNPPSLAIAQLNATPSPSAAASTSAIPMDAAPPAPLAPISPSGSSSSKTRICKKCSQRFNPGKRRALTCNRCVDQATRERRAAGTSKTADQTCEFVVRGKRCGGFAAQEPPAGSPADTPVIIVASEETSPGSRHNTL
ncbi:MAG: hypothetical protein CYPHOPRED_001163 [Cyphobasidiales sp. Tagirdzhanova-0007]|nr:MAG: hypothetical protein CYPHOPRED_001163 [Cyphobasidiales sp. Tagirdzhanova-0007]